MKSRRSALLIAGAVVVAALALSALGAGATRLVIPSNSVGTAQLKDNAVTGAKVKDNSLLQRDFKKGQLPAGLPGPQGRPGPSEAFTAFRDTPTPVIVGQTPASVAQLVLPNPGSYVIEAKAYFVSTGGGIPLLTCRLDTHDGDADQVQLLAGNATPVMLSVAHRYTSAGTVDLECAGRAPADASYIRITAIMIGELTATNLG